MERLKLKSIILALSFLLVPILLFGEVVYNSGWILIDNIKIDGNTITTEDTNGNLTITPNGTGKIVTSKVLDVGNLELDTNTISSTDTDGDIWILPDGTGSVRTTADLRIAGGDGIYFGDSFTDNVYVKAPAMLSASYTLTLPANAGTSGQVLSTNGSGVSSWVDHNVPLGYYDGNIVGVNFDLGGSNITSYTQFSNANMTLSNATGAISVGIACSAPATEVQEVGDTTCTGSEGDEVLGIVLTPLTTSRSLYLCFDFSHYIQDAGSGTNAAVQVTFQVIATENNVTTDLIEGRTRKESTFATNSAGGGEVIYTTHPLNVCGIFRFADTNVKRIVVKREQAASGTIAANYVVADANGSYGQRDIRFYGWYLP